MARSRPVPRFLTLAGERFSTIRLFGNSNPDASIAARTRSRASATSGLGRPMMWKLGSWRELETSTHWRIGLGSVFKGAAIRMARPLAERVPPGKSQSRHAKLERDDLLLLGTAPGIRGSAAPGRGLSRSELSQH